MNNPMGRMIGVFDGVSTDSYGIKLVNINSGVQTDPFLPQQDLVTDDSFYRDTPYYYKSRKSQLEITLRFFREGFWDDELKKKIVDMIDPEHDNFVEFFTEQNPNRRYFIKYVGESDFNNLGEQGGYFDVRFRMDSPYAYSEEHEVDYDFSDGNGEIDFYNDGNVELLPIMWIEKIESGSVSMDNKSIKLEFKIDNIMDGEEVFVNNDNGDIISNLEVNDVYRYDDHNGNYLKLKPGLNKIEVTGKCKIKMKYRFKYKG